MGSNLLLVFAILVSFLSVIQIDALIDEVPVSRVKNAAQKRAVCLDGSPAAYYYAAGSGEGIDSWVVYLMGGGWLPNNISAQYNRGGILGSTNSLTTYNFTGILSSNTTVNPDFHNWNRVFVHYCDGASFLGDTELNSGPNLQFRGSRIFRAVVEDLLERGMKNAKNAILSGGSAGGLACILHCDEFQALLPKFTRVACVADGGFFIHGLNLPHAGDIREKAFSDLISFHNLTDLLSTSCKSRRDPNLCLFPEYLVEDIKTPLFILNSAFDNIQISKMVKPIPSDKSWDNCTANLKMCSPPLRQLITDFGSTFLDTIKRLEYNPSRGMFINSCYSHTLANSNEIWNLDESQKLANKTMAQAVGEWYFNRSSVQLIDTQNKFPLNCTSSSIASSVAFSVASSGAYLIIHFSFWSVAILISHFLFYKP